MSESELFFNAEYRTTWGFPNLSGGGESHTFRAGLQAAADASAEVRIQCSTT